MFSVESFIKSYTKECTITIQLFGKMPEGALEYRPTPGQRSTLELLRYLSYGPYNVARRIIEGDWKIGLPANEATKDMPPSDFVRQMQWHSDEVARMMRAANPVALETELFTFPWNETSSKADGLINYPLKWMVGYRMQLFLYLKAAGAKDLGFKDLWQVS